NLVVACLFAYRDSCEKLQRISQLIIVHVFVAVVQVFLVVFGVEVGKPRQHTATEIENACF
ncbi:hypothetical protein, partial [Segatella copri]|uniref:hypothetical protein n=1 Tax=Segatella copri TaxID=165179 RepID=UPI0020CBEA49